MVYDSRRAVMVAFGSFAGPGEHGGTWEYDGAAWVRRETAQAPGARHGGAIFYDTSRGVVVLHGGAMDDVVLEDTWEYDGADWTGVETFAAPPHRMDAGATYDPDLGAGLLAGGGPGPLAGGQGLADTWMYFGP